MSALHRIRILRGHRLFPTIETLKDDDHTESQEHRNDEHTERRKRENAEPDNVQAFVNQEEKLKAI